MKESPEGPEAPGTAPATALAVAWTLLLASLAVLWVWSPFLGEATAFLVWSPPALALSAWTIRWLRSRQIEQVPSSPFLWTAVATAWVLALAAAGSELGPRLALDGLIMREPGIRLTGQIVRWAPLGFGCAVAVAGLAAALEARYRIVNEPRMPATPSDPAR